MTKNLTTQFIEKKDFSYMEKSDIKNGYLLTIKNKKTGNLKNAIVNSIEGFGRYAVIKGKKEEVFLCLKIYDKLLNPKKSGEEFIISKVYRPLNNKDFADINNYQLVAVRNKKGLKFQTFDAKEKVAIV